MIPSYLFFCLIHVVKIRSNKINKIVLIRCLKNVDKPSPQLSYQYNFMHAVQLYRCTCFVSIIMSFYLLHISNLFIWFLCPFDPAILQMSSMASVVLAYFTIVWFQKISIPPPPPRKGFAVWPPLPLWIFQNWPPKFTPPPLPSGISKIFAHPLEILLSLIEMNKEVVLFTRVPNFVSFM